jgi:hypothetical protein
VAYNALITVTVSVLVVLNNTSCTSHSKTRSHGGFDLRPIHVGFVVDQVTGAQAFSLEGFVFFPLVSFH